MDLHDLWFEITERGQLIPDTIYNGLAFLPDPVQSFVYAGVVLLLNLLLLLLAWRALSYVVIAGGSRLLLSNMARGVIDIGQDAETLQRFDMPVRLLAFAFVAHHYLEAWLFSLVDPVWHVNLEKVSGAVSAVAVLWLILRLLHHLLSRPHYFTAVTGLAVPERIVPFSKVALRFLFGILAGTLALEQIGVPLEVLIPLSATVGIGFSLGAKSAFADLIGFVGILFNDPFRIADDVSIDWQRGKVEDIGVSNTRLRQEDGSICVVPNNTLANAVVINHSRRETTAVEIQIALNNRSIEKLQDALGQITAYLETQSAVEVNAVAATDAGETVLITLDMRFQMIDRYAVMEKRGQIMLGALKILERYDVELASALPAPQRLTLTAEPSA